MAFEPVELLGECGDLRSLRAVSFPLVTPPHQVIFPALHNPHSWVRIVPFTLLTVDRFPVIETVLI